MNRLGLREIESRKWKAAQGNGLFDLFFGTLAFGVAAAASLTVGAVVFTRFMRDVPRKASLDGRPFQKTVQEL